jgi:hypothetical protein
MVVVDQEPFRGKAATEEVRPTETVLVHEGVVDHGTKHVQLRATEMTRG